MKLVSSPRHVGHFGPGHNNVEVLPGIGKQNIWPMGNRRGSTRHAASSKELLDDAGSDIDVPQSVSGGEDEHGEACEADAGEPCKKVPVGEQQQCRQLRELDEFK